jgi:tetratricopeptide (TPR) repeat protein
LYHHLGDNKIALSYSQESILLAQELGNGRILAFALTNLGHALHGLEQLEEAAAAYQQALALRYELGEIHLTLDPLAGIARISLAKQDLLSALAPVETILSYLTDNNQGEGLSDPFGIYLTCYQALQANNDPRAPEILQIAYDQLQKRAAQIGDPEMRHSFLKNVAAHRTIVEEWENKRRK